MERRNMDVPGNCEVFMNLPAMSLTSITINEFLLRLKDECSKHGEVASIAYKRKRNKREEYLLVTFGEPASARSIHRQTIEVDCRSAQSKLSLSWFNFLEGPTIVSLRARLSSPPKSYVRKGETWKTVRPLCFDTVGVHLGDRVEGSKFLSYLRDVPRPQSDHMITRFNFRVKGKATMDYTFLHPETGKLQKMLLNLSDVRPPIQIERRDAGRSLILWIALQTPPRKLKLPSAPQTSWDIWQGFGRWNRAIEHSALGRCNCMRIELLQPDQKDIDNLIKKIGDKHVIFLPEQHIIHIQEFTLPRETYFWTIDVMRMMPWFQETEVVLPTFSFAAMFAINCLLSWRTLQRHSLTPEFLIKLASYPEGKVLEILRRFWNPHESARALNTDQTDRAAYILHLLEGSSNSHSASLLSVLPETYVGTYRAIITPSNVHFFGPIPETSCRVLRQYRNMVDRFIRVHFTDEGFNSIAFSKKQAPLEFIDMLLNIRAWMDTGLHMGDRHYKFLLYSSTQLREHQCWFFAEEGDFTVSKLRHSLGRFKEIREVGKRAARMGQCFSSTHSTVEVNRKQVIEIEDIMTEEDGYCFTDGIGRISRDLAQKVALSLGLNYIPSAYQIRFAGCKGVVALDPNLEEGMCIRKSMKKFECDHHTLEICSYSRPLPAFLNRQGIMLLDNLGIQPEIFLRKQKGAIENIEGIERDPNKALKLVSNQSMGNVGYNALATLLKLGWPLDDPLVGALLHGLRQRLLTDLKLRARILITDGRNLIGVVDETHTLGYGQVFVQISEDIALPVKKRKNKGRQKKDVKEGEKVSEKWREPARKVIEGRVLITKFPALHPGDMRTFQAVDVPSLRHMVDCVVFPSKGARPHPNELSGSDLDGDLYLVLWDKELIPSTPNHPAGDYSPPSSSSSSQGEGDILDPRLERMMLDEEQRYEEEMKSFFLKYIANESLGMIANAWLAQADFRGVTSPECIRLAKLHSDAVDFPKTGIPVEVDPKLLDVDYPHYMEKEHTYTSDKVLGRLYDQVVAALHDTKSIDDDDKYEEDDDDSIWQEGMSRLSRLYSAFRVMSVEEAEEAAADPEEEAAMARDMEGMRRVYDGVIPQEGFPRYLEEAQRVKEEYNTQLEVIMNRYGYTTEAEAITGELLHLSKWHKKQKRDRSLSQTQELMRAMIADLWKNVREEFQREFSSTLHCLALEDPIAFKHWKSNERKAKAYAWFYVVYAISEEAAKGVRRCPMLSFAWVMAEYLSRRRE